MNLSPTNAHMPAKSSRVEPQPKRAVQPADFESAFHSYWPRIHALLFRLTGDPDQAEDLALEVFLRLHRQPRLLDPDQNLSAWLHRVAANLGYNALRAARRRQKYETAAGQLDLQTNPSPDPAREAERTAERIRVRRALATMKPRDAQLLLLRHSGLTYAALAAALQLNPASVGKLLSRAEKEFEKRYTNMTLPVVPNRDT
ncbi:MAG TPA: sigma-70 family RNA polymerase sigma factor [Anaerolineales bacterium]|nr:sigma-70 family RNA polymerase sigma factor [Anaerolineales bacterium]